MLPTPRPAPVSLDGHLEVVVADAAADFVFTVTNTGGDPVELRFRSGKVADVAVYEEGVEVWRWSRGRTFAQALRTERLAPGESATYERVWERPRPGRYVAEASLGATNVTLVERVPFEV